MKLHKLSFFALAIMLSNTAVAMQPEMSDKKHFWNSTDATVKNFNCPVCHKQTEHVTSVMAEHLQRDHGAKIEYFYQVNKNESGQGIAYRVPVSTPETPAEAGTPEAIAKPKFIGAGTLKIDFSEMGIGGLNEQMQILIRQVLISRIAGNSIRKEYGQKEIRGILLYGPPGTGKTLIARNIGQMIPNSVISVVNGPELENKWIGGTESNIRGLFAPAKRDPKNLYVLIFDEIDAIGRTRGGDSENYGSIHSSKVLTQLLTMIDGIDSASNVLVIGITNRKDVLDPALIRAGRLECHVEVSLPNETGRKEILDIYLKPLRAKNLAIDIDSADWAWRLDGYSGADIEALVSRATNLALLRNFDIGDDEIKLNQALVELSPLTNDDMLRAAAEFKSTRLKNNIMVDRYVKNYPVVEANELDALKAPILEALSTQMVEPYVVHCQNADECDRALMCHLALSLDLPYIKYVSYNEFIGHNSADNCAKLEDAYFSCIQAERAVLILDSLHDVNDRDLSLRLRFIINNTLPESKKLIIIVINPGPNEATREEQDFAGIQIPEENFPPHNDQPPSRPYKAPAHNVRQNARKFSTQVRPSPYARFSQRARLTGQLQPPMRRELFSMLRPLRSILRSCL